MDKTIDALDLKIKVTNDLNRVGVAGSFVIMMLVNMFITIENLKWLLLGVGLLFYFYANNEADKSMKKLKEEIDVR